LTVFFAVVLAKKYTNPSSDIIEVLAGLDSVDAVFTELVTSLDQVIRDGRAGKSTNRFTLGRLNTDLSISLHTGVTEFRGDEIATSCPVIACKLTK
jgi:hypothetical protein